MAFVFLEADVIDQKFRDNAEAAKGGKDFTQDQQKVAVRRPYRGIQIKQDTFATISIFDGRGQPISMVSESSTSGEPTNTNVGYVDKYADFILTDVNEERMEKSQIIETFGDSFIYFFGEKPRMVTFGGILVNSEDFNWRSQFWENWERFLRGSKLVERNARAFINYDTRVLEGYPLQASAQENSQAPYNVNFRMTMFMTNFTDYSRIGLTAFPGFDTPVNNAEARNKELSKIRDGFTSTTQDVRLRNLLQGPQSLAGALREGIRKVNSVHSRVNAFYDTAKTLLSGRVVRKPVGIAGFVNQLGQGALSAAIGSNDLNSLTNTLLSQAGADKPLRLAGFAKFAAVDDSIFRTRISANIDEYPLLEGEALKMGINKRLSISQVIGKEIRQSSRLAVKKSQSLELAALALKQEAEANVLGGIADGVNLAKSGFALFVTADSILSSPTQPIAVMGDALGVGDIGAVFNSF